MNKSAQAALAAASLVAALAAAPAFALDNSDLIGDRGDGLVASRTIQLNGSTRWVNVDAGEVVRFVTGDKSFQWSFAGLAHTVQLAQIAPQGTSVPNVMVHVNQNTNPLNEASGGGE